MRSFRIPGAMFVSACLLAASVDLASSQAVGPGHEAGGQQPSPFDGTWALNRAASEFPREIGFNPSWLHTSPDGVPTAPSGGSGGGRGRRTGGSGAGGGGMSPAMPAARSESYEDAQRTTALTAEVRNPAARLVVEATTSAFTITNERGQSRTFHPDGTEESIQIEGVAVGVTARRDGDRFVIAYHASPDREVRYTYSSSTQPRQLIVDVQFLERGAAGDKARRVYEPAPPIETRHEPSSGAIAASAQASGTLDQRPGAGLRGLQSVGIVVEELGDQAVACGLSTDAIERAVSEQLTRGGLTVRKNSDIDTYVYVNVMTGSLANHTCVSRYDAFLYTHAPTKLPYRDRLVLVQVQLMHRGGMGSSTADAHAATVRQGLESFIAFFLTQIHDANTS
jgi:hypothetical protein